MVVVLVFSLKRDFLNRVSDELFTTKFLRFGSGGLQNDLENEVDRGGSTKKERYAV